MSINCTNICEAVFEVVRFARCQPNIEQLELELRLAATPLFFYRQFAACTRLVEFERASAVYRGSRVVLADGGGRVRTEYAEHGQRLLSATRKERIAAPRDFHTDQGRLRVDLAREQPSQPVPGSLVRERQRVSFRLRSAPSWRVDFTRVVMGEERTHEIEIELDTSILKLCATADDAERLARQAAAVLSALGLTTPRVTDDEIECD